ncbi:hypothetical protein [Falsiroseomonas sp. HW251]|uniref:hypothetical protein n=1 Tax=Falsiroseomonas sp. HW251 TaxID=3390998 RepID=UPI003D318B6E
MLAKRLMPLLLLAGVSAAQAQESLAVRLQSVEGSVHSRVSQIWIAAEPGSTLAAGSAVRTGADGRATATLPGAALALDPGSNLDLISAEGATRMILGRGTMAVILDEAGAMMQVATIRGVAEIVQPGRYLIEAGDMAHPVRLSVFEGGARMVTASAAMPAQPGQVAWVAVDEQVRMGRAAATSLLVERLLAPPAAPPALLAAAPPALPGPDVQAPAPVVQIAEAAPSPGPAAPAPVAEIPAAAAADAAVATAVGRTETSTARSGARVASAAPARDRRAPQQTSRQANRQAAARPQRAPNRPAVTAAPPHRTAAAPTNRRPS